jgi:hypothetical protein
MCVVIRLRIASSEGTAIFYYIEPLCVNDECTVFNDEMGTKEKIDRWTKLRPQLEVAALTGLHVIQTETFGFNYIDFVGRVCSNLEGILPYWKTQCRPATHVMRKFNSSITTTTTTTTRSPTITSQFRNKVS